MRNSRDQALVKELVSMIGPTLTAFVAGTTDRREVADWLNGVWSLIQPQRIRLAKARELLNDVAEAKGNDYARAWFIGANTGDGLTSPAEALREDRFNDAEISAKRAISPEEMGY